MINGLKPYPATKESGLSWLGKIPQPWQVLRAKCVFRVIDVRSETGTEELLTVSSNDGVVPRSEKTVTMFKAESYVGHKLCWPGDLVINSLWAWMQGLGVARHYGLVSSAYSVYRPRPEFFGYANYLNYALRSAAYKWELLTRSKGVWLSRLQLSDPSFLDMPIILPTPDEQTGIVKFLDNVDRRIRKYIRAKQKLIKLLEEQKQAIIHRAVTRGLDPDVRLKPSGIKWIGNIPEHWTITRIKNEFQCLNHRRIPLSSTERGAMTSRSYDYYGASGVIDKVDDFLFDDDLLLIAEDGANLVLRNLPLAIIARGKFWVNNHAHILKSLRGNLGYFADVLESVDYLPWISGAAQPKLTKDRLMGITIAVPSIEEQNRIMEFVDKETGPLRSAIDQTQRDISLAREYRSCLISQVVTGKLDVREIYVCKQEEIREATKETELEESVNESAEEDMADLEETTKETEA